MCRTPKSKVSAVCNVAMTCRNCANCSARRSATPDVQEKAHQASFAMREQEAGT